MFERTGSRYLKFYSCLIYIFSAARGKKVAELAHNYKKFGEKFHAIEVSDIGTDQFPDALKGVDAVIHTAASLAERQAPEVILASAIEGTLNVVRQAEKAGIKRIVVTSSIVSVMNPANSFTDQGMTIKLGMFQAYADILSDWHPASKETALQGSKFDVYCAAKTLAEKELWAFSDAHPHLDITTLNPPYLYGPLAETFTLPTPNYHALSTDLYIYRLLDPAGQFMDSPAHADVRDIAKAHVLALNAPLTSEVGRKRILITSPHGFDMAGTLALIAESRPQLMERLTKGTPPSFGYDRTPIDFKRVEEVLGMTKDDFQVFEDTILDTVDSLLEVEKQWAAQGHEVSIPQD
ncbi:hypothetical protein H0H81_003685 [Sphagnurus paluster]|uniref:NAD-dependent epimerase/dehydratase domain-containing protein n=1 Tax=Sphagnurus paluster TaxID=117069 RepID=A0A9P7K617_9AGAR|nr:hypothetical protein H0H81_003685 [Sphagnurus paluster]